SPDGYRLDLSTHGAVQLELENPNLGKGELVVMERPTELGVGETVVSVPGTEPGVAGCFTPLHTLVERLECPIHPVQHVLKGLAVDIRKLRAYLLALDKGGGLLGKVDALTCHAIGISSMLKGGIVQLPTQTKRVFQ